MWKHPLLPARPLEKRDSSCLGTHVEHSLVSVARFVVLPGTPSAPWSCGHLHIRFGCGGVLRSGTCAVEPACRLAPPFALSLTTRPRVTLNHSLLSGSGQARTSAVGGLIALGLSTY